MTSVKKLQLVYIISLGAGLMDSASGLLLMLAPDLALRSMLVTPPDAMAWVYVRFIGAFVFSVGTLYLAGLWRVYIAEDRHTLRLILGVTAWVRLVVCVFTTTAIVSGALSITWMTVPMSDGFLACLQIFFLTKKWIRVGGEK